jgi:cbb3-type cytochrome oxidase subunit 3
VTFFIFAGDMLVMLFMAVLAVWLFWRAPKSTLDAAARIPLEDERRDG